MAAIEKICELSGEYHGWRMYRYKHNQLQILPKYRHLFRNADYVLEIEPCNLKWKDGDCSWDYDPTEWTEYEPPFINETEFIKWRKSEQKCQLVKEFKYTLIVDDPKLQGDVNGKYVNWTIDLPTTLRKLKRVLRCKNLNIKKVANA